MVIDVHPALAALIVVATLYLVNRLVERHLK